MNKKILVFLLACSMLLSSGCSLAKEEKAQKHNDRMVGIFLTPDTVDIYNDTENWIEYGSFEANTEFGKFQFPESILPAEFDEETGEFYFPGLEGYALFEATVKDGDESYHTVCSDMAQNKFGVKSTDFGDSYDLKGTLYVSEKMENTAWSANQVYQTEDGMVYLNGHGNIYSGGIFSGAVEETIKVTENGKEGSVSTRAEFSIETIKEIEKLLVRQYNENGELIDTQELSTAGEDKNISWAEDAVWAVVEEYHADDVVRTAYDRPEKTAEEVTHTLVILNSDGIGQEYILRFSETKY